MRREMRTKNVELGYPDRPLGKVVSKLPNIQQRIFYLNLRTEQIAVISAGHHISAKTGFLRCSLKTFKHYRASGAALVPVAKQQPVVEPPKPTGLDARRIIADVFSLNRMMRRRLAHASV